MRFNISSVVVFAAASAFFACGEGEYDIDRAGETAAVSNTLAATGFTVQLHFVNGVTQTQLAAFEAARGRWEQVITGDLGVVSVTNLDTGARCGNSVITGAIDDLLILVELIPADGAGGILAASTPCFLRPGGLGLPVIGYMFFDTADLDNLEAGGDLGDVVLHEMGHVLGFGTLWEASPVWTRNLLAGVPPEFFGAQAVGAYTGSNGGVGTTVPVEDLGGPGTSRSHWRETVFQTELMTGFMSGTVRPLSLTSVQSMADLGYVVNAAAADPFNIFTQPSLRLQSRQIELVDDIITIQMQVIGPDGRTRPLR